MSLTLVGGSRLDPYEILAPLGAGGMGEVCRARDTRLGRDVAIKIPDFGIAKIKASIADDAEAVARVSSRTLPGTVLGTAGYMAPEQECFCEGMAEEMINVLAQVKDLFSQSWCAELAPKDRMAVAMPLAQRALRLDEALYDVPAQLPSFRVTRGRSAVRGTAQEPRDVTHKRQQKSRQGREAHCRPVLKRLSISGQIVRPGAPNIVAERRCRAVSRGVSLTCMLRTSPWNPKR